MSNYKKPLLAQLDSLSIPLIWLISVSLSVILTECIVTGTALLLGETKLRKYLLIGLVASLCVSSLVVAILINLHQRMKEVLKNGQARFRTMIEIVPIPMAMMDAQFNVTFINPAFIKTFGYALDDIPTLQDWWVKAYPDSTYRQAVIKNWQDMLSQLQDTPKSFPDQEVNVCCKNGTVKTLLVSFSPILDVVTTAYVVALYDITELKHTERELAQSARFSALIEAIPDAIFFKDGQGRWQITNEPAKQLFQLHDIAWQNKTDRELAALHPEFSAAHEMCLADDEAAWEAKQLTVFHETVVNEGGKKAVFEVRKVPLFAQNGQREALVIIGRDITEKKQLEAQLSKLAQAVEQSPESIVITNQAAEIEYVNAAFTQITGYSREESLGKKTSIFSSSKTPAETYANLWSTLRQGQSWKGEFINYRKDGSEYIDLAVIAPLREPDGVISHYVAINTDVTRKRRLEKELEQYHYHLEELVAQRTLELREAKAQAESANQAKSEFLANMSHEIRTPMNAILGFGDILSDLITDKTQLYYLNAVKSSGKTLLQLINDVLDLSKVEAGKLELDYKSVCIKSVFDDIYLIFMQKVSEKSLGFRLDIAKDIPPFLMLDEIRLRQVLLNIISNAIKFTHSGLIHLRASMQENSLPEHIDLIISIADSGIGIAKDQLDSIFLAFTQQKNQSSSYGGTGLGLTISKRLVEMMGGTISINSEKGQGSCFTVTLTKVKVCHSPNCQAEASKIKPFKVMCFQPASLLLVDDIEFNRLLIKSYLQDYPELKLLEAENAEQVLKLTLMHQFDLILMDKRLPDMDGNEVCEKIKALPDCADIPIIMITASAVLLPTEQPAFYDLRLNKPITKTELLNAMQLFLRIDESVEIDPHLSAEAVIDSLEKTASPEKLQELVALLKANYQVTITQLNNSGGLQIDSIFEIAEQLLEIARQYHCKPLDEWANLLKNQAELFDLINLPKTLSSFDSLVYQLNKNNLS